MARSIFVSYDFKDRDIAPALPSVQKNFLHLVCGKFVFVTEEISQLGDAALDEQIGRRIEGCDAAIILIGAISPKIEREVELAVAKGLPILGGRLKDSIATVPARLRYWKRYRETGLRPGPLDEALNVLAKRL
jgi:hypothetical protein